MRRETLTPRAGWAAEMEEIGFHFHSMGGVYWDESACYGFDAAEIDTLEAATAELHAMALEAVEHIVRQERFEPFALPMAHVDYVAQSWKRRDPSLYGRMDLRFDGQEPPKLLEYNADTPTALLEASVAQWRWLKAVKPGADQYNSIHERLLERWQALAKEARLAAPIAFTCSGEAPEDLGTVEYLADTASQAGLDGRLLLLEDIGWDEQAGRFVDLDEAPVTALFKLYPWEWMLADAFGPKLRKSSLKVIEPAWKALLSNKAILPILWELFPQHPNLLPCAFEPGPLGDSYVKKPRLSREGANVSVVLRGQVTAEAEGPYGAEGFVYQALAPLPAYDGNYPVIGSWVVGDVPCGIGIREDRSPITKNSSRFVPHYFA